MELPSHSRRHGSHDLIVACPDHFVGEQFGSDERPSSVRYREHDTRHDSDMSQFTILYYMLYTY